MQAFEQCPHSQCIIDGASQIGAGPHFSGGKFKHCLIEPGADQVVLHRLLVLEVLTGLAARHLVERRLRDVEVPALDQLRHLPEEKGQQQRANMAPSTSASVMMMILW
jgi:hypothetical protein